ncbi:MAG: D-sedoheptulose 7-phosphate isomerase [Verrucomicrobia bacterium]|nr:D-sedoheptulose 7-phosphate isomerase [Verrucomicrobiota bacterium]
MNQFIIHQIKASIEVKQAIMADAAMIGTIKQVAAAVIKAYRNGHKLLLAGNGGSAADAQHLAGELVNRFRFDRPALPAISLSTDTSVLTCIANDSDFKNIFARQVQALGVKGDMFVGISTSGSSPNVLKALEQCRAMKIISIGLTGRNSAKMEKLCDYCIAVPSEDTPRVQEAHITIGHILCDLIESSLFKRK